MQSLVKFFKRILKRIVPVTFHKAEMERHCVERQIKKELTRLNSKGPLNEIEKTRNEIVDFRDFFITKIEKTNEFLVHQQDRTIELLQTMKSEIERLDEMNKKLQIQQEAMKRTLDENMWAHVFNNTIIHSNWLENKSFSPGRWAMGYVELYVLYRALDEFQPKKILELGLGQSTKMITQYVKTDKDICHDVVENNNGWIEFYKNSNSLPENTEIVQMDWEMMPYKESENVRVFKGFKKQFGDKKFDFIMIDAPLGGDMTEYSRIDILSILPNCLEKSFVMILDDAERHTERKTIDEIDRILNNNMIPFRRNLYHGQKDVCIWTTPEWGFLCSM